MLNRLSICYDMLIIIVHWRVLRQYRQFSLEPEFIPWEDMEFMIARGRSKKDINFNHRIKKIAPSNRALL